MQLIIHPATALKGEINVPGDKSISHRAIMFAALAEGDSHITGWLPANDCWATVSAMRALGVEVEVLEQTETSANLLVHGVGRYGFKNPTGPIDCQGSGTTMRLLAGLLAGQPLDIILDGHEGLRRRPMERIATPLRHMGAKIETTDGRPPLHIKGTRLTAIDYTLPVASAQVKSAILLAGLFAEGKTVVHEPGPTRDHTERMLAAQKVPIRIKASTIEIDPEHKGLSPLHLTVPADFSSAAFPMVAALIVPGSNLYLKQINVNQTRTGLLDVLNKMGAAIRVRKEADQGGEPVADLVVKAARLSAIAIGGDIVVRMIDEFPILAVAATQAHGTTIVRDAAELRVKETDRIQAVVDELSKMGAKLIPHDDGFEVHGPTPLIGAEVHSHGDHRLAMALAVAGLIAEGTTVVDDAGVIADSYPGFVTMLKKIGAEVQSS
jgi:3-phosphoshikimate 1-carboxyvinyltransferase